MEDIRRLVADTLGPEPEYRVHFSIHADGEAFSVNVMKDGKVALRTHSEDQSESIAMMAEALNRLWALNMTRQFGPCSQ